LATLAPLLETGEARGAAAFDAPAAALGIVLGVVGLRLLTRPDTRLSGADAVAATLSATAEAALMTFSGRTADEVVTAVDDFVALSAIAEAALKTFSGRADAVDNAD
jgi:hypothetical protein